MSEDNPSTLFRRMSHFLTGTLFSRFTGLARDLSMAWVFGVTPAVGAFWAAYRFANLLRRVLGEGSLLMGYAPHYESLRNESKEKGKQFFYDLTASLVVLLIAVVLLGELTLSLFSNWASTETQSILHLTQIMLPSLFFISLYGLFAAHLQCQGKYFLSGVAPAFFNLVWIGSVWLLRSEPPGQAMERLAWMVLVAFAVQCAALLPRLKVSIEKKIVLFSPAVRNLFYAMGLSIIGVAGVQVNSALDAVFALYAMLEGPAYLTYAIRIQQLPLALFGVAMGAALLPALSRACEERENGRYWTLIRSSVARSLLLLIPCTLALLFFGSPIVSLLYERGEFTASAVQHTTWCLWGYAIGLVPAGLVVILSPAFYARKDFKTPVGISLLSIVVNIALNSLLIFGWHAHPASVAYATSAAAWVQCALLVFFLNTKILEGDEDYSKKALS